jgi:hypothetical protein
MNRGAKRGPRQSFRRREGRADDSHDHSSAGAVRCLPRLSRMIRDGECSVHPTPQRRDATRNLCVEKASVRQPLARLPIGCFEDWWEPFLLGVGPAGSYVAQLDPGDRLDCATCAESTTSRAVADARPLRCASDDESERVPQPAVAVTNSSRECAARSRSVRQRVRSAGVGCGASGLRMPSRP